MICGEAVGRLDRDKEVASGSRAEPASDGARVRGRGSPRYEVAVFQYGAFLGAIYGSTAKKRRRKSSASPETRSESIGNDSFVASRRTSSTQRARPIGAAVHDELAAHTRHMEAPRLRIAGFFCCLDCGAEGDRTPDLI